MKKQDIRNAYTQKVTELLNQGYTLFPDTMGGSQGEIAHIDLTNGSEIIRVLLERGLCWSHISDGFHGDVVTLTVGRAAADTWVGDRWDGTIWNSRLEPSFQIKQGTQPKEVHPMMNRNQAIAYGKHIGVRWHIYNSNGCLVGGTKTLEQAQAMKRRFEIEERSNPWTHGTTRFEIREAK